MFTWCDTSGYYLYTAKCLLGVTLQGIICFVSKAWGGRTPDKHLPENCRVTKYLLPGDVILADRGFDIGDSDAHFEAIVEIPAFTKGKKQLSAFDVERSSKLASVRLHVELLLVCYAKNVRFCKAYYPWTTL